MIKLINIVNYMEIFYKNKVLLLNVVVKVSMHGLKSI